MDEIPVPHVLDPNRMLLNTRGNMAGEEHKKRAELLEQGLEQTCDYGQQLWHCLNQMREFLWEMVPSESDDRVGARPTGPADEDGWQRWISAYAAVSSALSGPHGDSGYGHDQARREAQLRRAAASRRQPRHPTLPVAPDGNSAARRAQLALAAGGAFLAGLVLRRPEPARSRRAPRRRLRASDPDSAR